MPIMITNTYKDQKLNLLEKKLGIKFKNPEHLVQAFTHRSYLNENRGFPLSNNERLEFLGDAVLELIVTEHLFHNFLNPEGELTTWRAALVNAKMCARIANELGLENYLLLSHGEAKDSGSKAREYILANTLEALIGAMYFDLGLEETKQFIHKWIISKLPEVLDENLWMDPKSRFQESAQEIMGITPIYKVLHEEGPDHQKDFTVGVYLGKEKIAEGRGLSKQEAQTAAAEEALKIKEWKGHQTKILYRKQEDPIG